MTRTVSDSFASNGAVTAPWSLLSGAATISSQRLTFTTAPGSNPLAVCELGLRSNGRADVDAKVRPSHVYGDALFVRVVDATNWVRAVLRAWTTTYQYYVTEYQHTIYRTETLWQPQRWTDRYQPQRRQLEVSYNDGCTAGTFSAYTNTGSPTMCRATAPTAPASETGACGLVTREYRYVTNSFQCGTAGNNQYQLQQRTRTVTQNRSVKWVEEGYAVQSGETLTGNTRLVLNGSVYDLTSSSSAASNPGQTTSPKGTYDAYVSTFKGAISPQYWAVSQAFPLDTSTGSTRQVADSTYWDQTFEAGAPTRQAGPFTGTDYHYGVTIEKAVAGVVTTVAGPYEHGSTNLNELRVTAENDQVKVYLDGDAGPVLTGTCADFKTTGSKVGLGGGASAYNPTAPIFDDFAAKGLSSEYVRRAGVMVRVDRKVRVAGAWVDVERGVK